MFNKIKCFLFENQNQKQTLAKNTFWLFTGQLSGRFLRAGLVIFAARILGPESWGAFSYVMGLIAFLLILSDIGIGAIVTRESAKDPEKSAEYFSTAFFLKIFLLLTATIILIFGAPYLTKIPEARALMRLVILLLIFDSLRNFGFAISRALEQMQWEAFNEFLTNFFIIAVGFYALIKFPSSESLAYAYIIGTGIGLLAMIWTLRRYFKKIFTHFNGKLILPIIYSSLPFAFASFLGAIMINTDLIMLGWMRSPEEIGFYSAAQKPIQLLYTMAGLFATSLFPLLSRLHKENNKERIKNIFEQSLTASLFVALPTAIVGLPLGADLIRFLFGSEYLPAVEAFQILLLTLLIIFPSVIVSNTLLAFNEQKKFIRFSLIGAVGNVIFNFLLIPYLGILGCAISTLIAQILANAFIWKKMDNLMHFRILNRIWKIIFASIASAGLAILFQSAGFPILFIIALSAGAYIAILLLLKEPMLKNIGILA